MYFSNWQFKIDGCSRRSARACMCVCARLSLHNSWTFGADKGCRRGQELRSQVLSRNAPCDRLTVLFLTKWETSRTYVCAYRFFFSRVAIRLLRHWQKAASASRDVVTPRDKIYTCARSAVNRTRKVQYTRKNALLFTPTATRWINSPV